MTKQASKAFIWAFVRQSLTGYRFDLTRGGSVPVDVLGEPEGVVSCDDYRGCDPLAKKGFPRRAGCLPHARRKYFEAGDVPEAKEALKLISVMYRVEQEAERREVIGTEEHRRRGGAVDGRMFLRFVTRRLAPWLRPGDIVIMDNLNVHKMRAVSDAIAATGPAPLYLPTYSPQLIQLSASRPI